MNFKYNPNTFTIESDDPETFVRLVGKNSKQGTFFALYSGDIKIGLATNCLARQDQTEIMTDGSVIWRFSEVGCALYKEHQYLGPGIDEDIPPYRFNDTKEQNHILDLFLDALKVYPGTPDLTFLGENQKPVNNPLPAQVEYTEGVKLLVSKEAYIRQNDCYYFDRSLFIIKSSDPEIYVELVGSGREMGDHYILHINGKKIGFATAESNSDVQTEILDDGTLIRRIDAIGCVVPKDTVSGRAMLEEYRFSNMTELKHAMALLITALRHYKGMPNFYPCNKKIDVIDQGMCLTEYTSEVMKKVASGEYL